MYSRWRNVIWRLLVESVREFYCGRINRDGRINRVFLYFCYYLFERLSLSIDVTVLNTRGVSAITQIQIRNIIINITFGVNIWNIYSDWIYLWYLLRLNIWNVNNHPRWSFYLRTSHCPDRLHLFVESRALSCTEIVWEWLWQSSSVERKNARGQRAARGATNFGRRDFG